MPCNHYWHQLHLVYYCTGKTWRTHINVIHIRPILDLHCRRFFRTRNSFCRSKKRDWISPRCNLTDFDKTTRNSSVWGSNFTSLRTIWRMRERGECFLLRDRPQIELSRVKLSSLIILMYFLINILFEILPALVHDERSPTTSILTE